MHPVATRVPPEARYWTMAGGVIVCRLCPHNCRIQPESLGRCGIRRYVDGRLVAEAYARVSSLALDPIEKKPLYHVRPGTKLLSLGSAGCNFHCSFCQNWSISQRWPKMSTLTPGDLADAMREQRAIGAAYTYNEPVINFEYVLDCAKAVRQAGGINVMVSNGYIQPEPLQELLPWIDAWNIDLKSIRPEFYQEFCGAKIEPVLATIRSAAAKCHVELTHLLVTGGNDTLEQVGELVDWVAAVSPEIPVHFSRYFPQYQWQQPSTDPGLLRQTQALAKQKLKWVYLGNFTGDDSVACPDCGQQLVERQGYETLAVRVEHGQCPQCHRQVPGIWA